MLSSPRNGSYTLSEILLVWCCLLLIHISLTVISSFNFGCS
uniref:Uncharacterized protein n=1 Tax=Rhizophora mucronata TaxID=61149 RepID=A0A2P2J4A5_RHIMU